MTAESVVGAMPRSRDELGRRRGGRAMPIQLVTANSTPTTSLPAVDLLDEPAGQLRQHDRLQQKAGLDGWA